MGMFFRVTADPSSRSGYSQSYEVSYKPIPAWLEPIVYKILEDLTAVAAEFSQDQVLMSIDRNGYHVTAEPSGLDIFISGEGAYPPPYIVPKSEIRSELLNQKDQNATYIQ